MREGTFQDPNHTPAEINQAQPPVSGTRENRPPSPGAGASFSSCRGLQGKTCCYSRWRCLSSPPFPTTLHRPGPPSCLCVPGSRSLSRAAGQRMRGRAGRRAKPGDSRNPSPPGERGWGCPSNLAAAGAGWRGLRSRVREGSRAVRPGLPRSDPPPLSARTWRN